MTREAMDKKIKSQMDKKIKIVIWNEFVHERENNALGDYIRTIYPDGIHRHLAHALAAQDLQITTATLQDEAQGLPPERLDDTDVLLWWGHCAHDQVEDALAERIALRVFRGMGLIVLHSGHLSKPFRRLMGTPCRLHWREAGEKERVWVCATGHPIVQGVPESFVLPHSEMYGEPFDLPGDGQVITMSWYEGGNVFRSGMAFQRGAGRIFYFSPGHETYPIYHDSNVLTILGNAIRWATPTAIVPERVTPSPVSAEPIHTANPLANLDTSALHQ